MLKKVPGRPTLLVTNVSESHFYEVFQLILPNSVTVSFQFGISSFLNVCPVYIFINCSIITLFH